MTKVKLHNGMRFRHHPVEEGNEFYVEEYDFYGEGKEIWCACTDTSVYPLDEICLSEYEPNVDGEWIKGPIEYEY